MDIQQMKGHKLKTILQFSIPSIIAMLLETVITITDGYFTGRYVGENALAAINLGLPVLYLYLGAGLCIGVGGSAVYSRLLGAGEQKRASEVFSQTMVTAMLVCVALSVCVFAFFTPILGFLKADGALGAYFTDYYKIMLFAYPLMVIRNVSGMAIRSAGQPQICMLERSAWRLKVEKQKSVTEIGEDYGYSASNFAAAFKKHLNVSPAAFRKISEQWVEESTFAHGMHLGELESEGKKITVEYLGAYTVICERKKGNYHNLARQWCEFIEKYAEYADENTPSTISRVIRSFYSWFIRKFSVGG